MELILERIAKRKTYTIGRLSLSTTPTTASESPLPLEGQGGGSYFESPLPLEGQGGGSYFCDTLEPTWRDYKNGAYKVKGRSAIPEGRYAVVISFSPKFKQWLPILLGVPKFDGIRIHAGNCSEDTEGCILVGKNKLVGQVVDSRIWLHRLKQKIVEAKGRGEPVWITIQ